jgi:thiosulfate reductase cytochrome b subunit
VVRVTHWIHSLSFCGLAVSGIAILLSHTRFYWGETGAEGAPSLFDLPLQLHRDNVSGWGRSLHFLSAWVSILNGSVYIVTGLLSKHFRNNLLPTKADLSWESILGVVSTHLHLKRHSDEEFDGYNILQRLTYLLVVFVMFPLVMWTGLAMSIAITSVFPALVTILGGQQSARTIHFFVANFLILFLVVHIAMVCLAGFAKRVRAMITGRSAPKRELT